MLRLLFGFVAIFAVGCFVVVDPDLSEDCPDGCFCTAICVGDCECSTGCTCNYECQGDRCETLCARGSSCAIEASGNTLVRCGTDASCELECSAPGASCEMRCGGGRASCILDCGGNSDCQLSVCSVGGVRDCGGGVSVCNRPCP